MEEDTQENTINITEKSESRKAMKNRCSHCKQTEGFICDSVHFNDGDHTVEELLEFRKMGFSIINEKKCQCFKDFNEVKISKKPMCRKCWTPMKGHKKGKCRPAQWVDHGKNRRYGGKYEDEEGYAPFYEL